MRFDIFEFLLHLLEVALYAACHVYIIEEIDKCYL